MTKKTYFVYFLGGPMGPIHPVWALAAIHPGWGNRYFPFEPYVQHCVGGMGGQSCIIFRKSRR